MWRVTGRTKSPGLGLQNWVIWEGIAKAFRAAAHRSAGSVGVWGFIGWTGVSLVWIYNFPFQGWQSCGEGPGAAQRPWLLSSPWLFTSGTAPLSMQLLDGFSVTVGGGNKMGEIDGFFLWSCMKKNLFIVFLRQLASGTKWYMESFLKMNWSPCCPTQKLMDIKAMQFSRKYRQKCKSFHPARLSYTLCVCVH